MIIPPKSNKPTRSFIILLLAAGLLIGSVLSVAVFYFENQTLISHVTDLENQVSVLSGFQNATYQNITIYQNGTSLADIYESVHDSVVLIQGKTSNETVQGSGFVYNYSSQMVIITNYHVVEDTTSRSVTFSDGNGYTATILGTDPYADLAVLSVPSAPSSEFKPLQIVSSSTLRVGEQVFAIGNPYGLTGSLTTGVVSALGRTITEDNAGGFAIANVIQTDTSINPGNSGGPLLNEMGSVVGITTAIVSDSQGLGFVVPSNAILRELYSLINYGGYSGHSYLGVSGVDMNYDLAQQYGVSVTYGWRIASVITLGPSYGVLNIGDIIIAMNGTRITNGDDLSSYLEEYTLPNQNLVLTVMRNNAAVNVTVTLGTRPQI